MKAFEHCGNASITNESLLNASCPGRNGGRLRVNIYLGKFISYISRIIIGLYANV